ncbi:hypothetical protein [Paraburkholderia sp.]|uniref:hypothetical protein n=1 Tax=Paraburkholderia sp. TaxID=1926495 RepID=UPI003C7980CF
MVKASTTSPAPIAAAALRHATDDFTTLGTVFGWLDEMLASILDLAKNEESRPEMRLLRIRALADCGRYLAKDWENATENMADAARAALNASAEADHGN